MRRDRSGPLGICFVIDRLGRAGTETQLLTLIRDLDRDRVRPSLCLLNGSDRESRGLLPRSCPVLDLRLPRLGSAFLPAAAARLAAFWRRNRIDVVQTYFLDSTYFAVPLARMCGIRHVVRVRNNVGYWLTRRHGQLSRLVGRLSDVTLTNSASARQAILNAEGLPRGRVEVIHNGVDLVRFAPNIPPRAESDIVRIGAVANLRPVKNVDGLIRAAEVVCQRHPRVQFEVAGEGEDRLGLEKQIRNAGLDDRFRLLGSVADVPGFLARLDVAVLCSHSESMSNALLEYMAAGLPVVATDVGANGSLVRDEREGLIVPPGNSAALAEGIHRLVGDPARRREFGKAARRRAEKEFSRAAMVRRFEDFYESLQTNAARGKRAGRPCE
jgi:glycosyltransferase involved in cell wall biosynthesis